MESLPLWILFGGRCSRIESEELWFVGHDRGTQCLIFAANYESEPTWFNI